MFKRTLFFLVILISFALADSSGDFVMGIANKTNEILSKGNKENEYLDFIKKNIDMDFVSNFVLGANARNLNDNNKKEFKDLYSKYLLNNYMSKLKDYSKDLKVNKIVDKGNNVYFVESTTKDKNGTLVNVNFRVVKKESYKITDIIAEGISFIGTLRTDVNSSIQQNGFEKFMEDLRVKSR
ncbi:MAG: ABC transporter substrate-binding protein [Rickettsiales bacterium]|jgi:phospholipid transport system substrate-binding protein|nr:ABC transporter substrate-binding protein [Rickettsiales bacterium]